MKKISLLLLITPLILIAQPRYKKSPADQWVDSVYQQMTFNEKVGQLFMVAAYSNRNENHVNQLEELITKQHVGGVIFFQGGPYRQAKITNRLQEKAKVPLFVGIDGEWGLSMRLDSTYRYPWNMSLGAIKNNELIYKMGQQMAQQAKRMNIHFMFAPVVDINTNAHNPVIGNRSFGENKKNVADKAWSLIKGMQDGGVYATAKHFPGHGDTSIDSHHTLPVVNHTKHRMNDVELYPYRQIISKGLASIMVAHLDVPVYEPNSGTPSSLSYKIVTDLLKDDLKFEGLIFTDALNMKGASNFKSPGEIDLEAFLAGNDVLLFPEDVPKAIEKFNEALESQRLSEERLAYSVKKILKYKYNIGLNKYKPIALENLNSDLHLSQNDDLSFQLYQSMVTVLQNKNNFLPLQSKDRIAYVNIADQDATEFIKKMQRYGQITVFTPNDIEDYIDDFKGFDKVIIGYHREDNTWKNHEFSNGQLDLIDKIARVKPTILVSFAKPYALAKIKNTDILRSVMIGFQNNAHAFEAVSNALFGFAEINGKAPVSIGNHWPEGTGVWLESKTNIQQSKPQLNALDATELQKISNYGKRVVADKLAPGAQILVVKNGNIVYDEVFGKKTYEADSIVNQQTVYDLASLSKILGTLPLVMKLYEQGQLKFEDKLGDLLPEFKKTDKANITVKELLTHQSGLVAWIPFYKNTLDEDGRPARHLYQSHYSKDFNVQVSENLYLKSTYKNEILNQIKESKLGAKKYVYSDLNFILLQQIVEKKFNKPLDVALYQYFIEPMGLQSLRYNPQQYFDVSKIAPTEIDNYFRYTKIQGYVHDMGAAMLGGVAGHAGLFGNAYDVAQFMQMFLDKGTFKGKKILNAKTIDAFNVCFYCSSGNRRGAGFDKPQIGNAAGPTCGCASSDSFGHTGFTGTMVWADPTHDLVYVFLSNRTYPNADVNRLSRANIREDIQQIIYNSISN